MDRTDIHPDRKNGKMTKEEEAERAKRWNDGPSYKMSQTLSKAFKSGKLKLEK